MKKLISLLTRLCSPRVGSRKDDGSTRLRVVFDSFTCRLRVCPLKLVSVLAILLTLGVWNAWGVEATAYTLTPASGSNNSYANDCDIDITDASVSKTITWTLEGNSQQQPWRIGVAKKAAAGSTTRALYSKTAISENITKVVVTHGEKSGLTEVTLTLNVYSTAAKAETGGDGDISSVSVTYADNTTMTFNRPAGHNWAGRYYRFDYGLTWTYSTSAQYVAFSNAVFKYESASCTENPSIGAASLNGSFNLSSVGVSCASSGAGTNCSITEYGWVWSDGTNNTNPTIGGSGVTNSPKTSGAPSGSGGSFTGTLSGSFTLGHTYYYKAYVTNGKPATEYSAVQTFTPRSVTFNSNGGSAVATKYVNNGGTLSAPDDPTREHFTFGGWYTDDGTFASAVNWSSAINEDKTYYAKWTEDPYKTVVFKNNDDEIDGYASVKVYVGERPSAPTLTDGASNDACDETSDKHYGWTTSTWSGSIATQATLEEDYTVYAKNADLPVVTAGDPATITYNAVWAEAVGVPSDEYQLVTNISQLIAGDKIVIANAGSSSTYLMGKDTVTEAGYQFRKVAQGGTFSISSSKIAISTSASSSTDRTNPHVFTVGKSGDYWTFYDPLNSAYISCASDGDSKNGLGYENSLSDAGKWDISISGDNKATILSQIGTSTRNRLQANGNPFSIASSFTCSKNTMTDPYIFRNLATLGYQNYMTTCCDKNITIGTPSITGGGTVAFSVGGSAIAVDDVVETCSAAKNIVVRVTPGSGYECTALSFSDGTNSLTPSPTTASTLPFGYDDYTDYTLSFSKETTSITLETEVTFSAKALTGWSWKYKKGADAASDGVDPYTIPETVEVYKNEYARFFIVGYDPEDVIDSKKGFVYVSSDDPEEMQPVFDKSELSYSSKNAACSYYQLYGKKVVESSTITFKSAGNASLTKTFTIKVKALPSVTFVDLIHNKTDFTNWGTDGVVSSTVTTGVVTHVKPTPTHTDLTEPATGNSCEKTHLHLIGWIRSDYSKVADYMNGTGSEPTVSELTGAGTGYWFTPGADINIETYNGKTFYAVWAVEE